MNRPAILAAFFLAAVAMAGCGSGNEQKQEGKIADLEKRIEALEGGGSDFKTPAAYELADLHVGKEGYSLIVNQYGWFPVFVNKTEKYMDGQMVSVTIGNPTGALFNGFSLYLIYGRNLDKEKTIESAKPLKPGQYTKMDFLITPAGSEDVSRMRMGIGFSEISLIDQ